MRVLVTGASGYIGHHVCLDAIGRGWEVHALTRPGSDLRGLAVRRHDVDAPTGASGAAGAAGATGETASLDAAMAAARPDVVMHLASMVKAKPSPGEIGPMVDANVGFGARLLDAMTRHGCRRLVNASTYWIHDAAGGHDPNTLYAATKLAFEQLIDFHARRGGLSAISLVLFDVYGPADWRGKLLGVLASAMREGRTLDLSPAEQTLDMVHVRDVAAGFAAAATRLATAAPGHERCSLGGGERRTLREIVELAARLRGVPVPARFGVRPYDPFQVMTPVSSIERLPGWAPEVTLEQGVAEALG